LLTSGTVRSCRFAVHSGGGGPRDGDSTGRGTDQCSSSSQGRVHCLLRQSQRHQRQRLSHHSLRYVRVSVYLSGVHTAHDIVRLNDTGRYRPLSYDIGRHRTMSSDVVRSAKLRTPLYTDR